MPDAEAEPPAPIVRERHRHGIGFSILAAVVAVTWALGGALIIFNEWALAAQDTVGLEPSVFTPAALATPAVVAPREKPPQQTVKGVYLTAYSANNPKKLDEIIKLIDTTELNAVILDIKDYTGYVLYDSQIPLVKNLHTKKVLLKDPAAIIKKLHDHTIYVLARQTVFQDPVLAAAKPAWAIKDIGGGVWRDNKGLSWVDATRKEVWKYNFDIAREAAAFGFDEINFDYVRFPSDGNMSRVAYAMNGQKKYQIMGEFYKNLGEELADEPVWLSLDMFGLTMEATSTNDLSIGQRIVDAVAHVDYISPMMYPSHYPPGHLKLKNPADNPTAVFEHGMLLGMPKFAGTRARVRPWIQAFNLGAVYDGAKIRAQINAIEKFTDAGWLMWNASNRYTSAGLGLND